MAAEKELNKGIDWTKWMGLVIALGALLYAHLAYQNSRSAIEFQKQEANRRRADIVKLQAAWDFRNVYFSGFEKVRLLVRFPEWEEKSLGLHFFAWLKLFNASEHPISVDGVCGWFIYKNTMNSQLMSFTCFEEDFVTDVQFPLSIKPHEQRRVLIRMPIPVDEERREIFDQLVPDSLYTAKQIVQAWNQKARVRYSSSPENYQSILFQLFRNQFVPRDSMGTLDQHAFKASVYLASGEIISKKFHLIMMD